MPFQLRRVGKSATIIGVKDILRLNKDITRFGRHSQNDHFLDSAEYMCLISRWHSEIHCVDQDGQQRFVLRDNGLNGTYVNDVRVDGNLVLEKGDIVTFGHPNGKNIKPGEMAVQTESEFSFEFEYMEELLTESAGIGTPPRLQHTKIGKDTTNTLGRAAVMCSPIIPVIKSHTMMRSSPSTSSGTNQETPSVFNRNVNNNVSRRLIEDTVGSSTFILKDISNTGTKSPGLVHLDQLFATHNASSPNRSTSPQDEPVAVTESDDEVFKNARLTVQQFADDTESDEDIFSNDNPQDLLETQSAYSRTSPTLTSTVSQLQMHLQMPIQTSSTTVYPSLNSIFEKPSQLTTQHVQSTKSRKKNFVGPVKTGAGRGKSHFPGQQSALDRHDSITQATKGKKRKKKKVPTATLR